MRGNEFYEERSDDHNEAAGTVRREGDQIFLTYLSLNGEELPAEQQQEAFWGWQLNDSVLYQARYENDQNIGPSSMNRQ